MFSWRSSRSILTSRAVVLRTASESSASLNAFIATGAPPAARSRALKTVPYAPLPIASMTS